MTTENFDLIVKFKNSIENGEYFDMDCEVSSDVFLGIEEIEFALKGVDPKLYIKESELFNVVLVELGNDSIEAAEQLNNSNPKIISRVIPISRVVKTDLIEIIDCLKIIAVDKMDPGDKYRIDSFILTQKDIKTKEILDTIEQELEKIDMKLDDNDPKWNIYVEIIGENTGLNILKYDDFLKLTNP